LGSLQANARCETDNFNSDRPEGSGRYSHFSKSASAPSTNILQCLFNFRNVPEADSIHDLGFLHGKPPFNRLDVTVAASSMLT
jgi:hypothetical protein